MGKGLNKANADAIPMTSTHIDDTSANEPAYSAGELGQLQEILFGQQQRTTNQQLHALQAHVDERLENLNQQITNQFSQIDKRMSGSTEAHQQQFDQLQSKHAALDEIQAKHATLLVSVQESLTDLRQQKVDTEKLTKVLTDMAGALSTGRTNSE